MLSNSVIILVLIFSCKTEWTYCEKATVPPRICERNIAFNLTYKTSVNESVIIRKAAFVLPWIIKNQKNLVCNNSKLNITVNRTLYRSDKDITAGYKIIVGIKKEVNYTMLGAAVDECRFEIVDYVLTPILQNDTTRKAAFVDSLNHFINGHDTEPKCEENIVSCPPNSEKVNTQCECSRGSYLDKDLTTCIPCPKNTYQELTGQFNCMKCKGYTTLNQTACNGKDITEPPTSVEPTVNGGGDELTIVLATLLPMLAVLVIVGVLLFHFWRKKKRKERELRDIEEFKKNFKIIEFSNSDDHEKNEDKAISGQETEAQPITTLGNLAEDVERRGLEIPRDCIVLTRTRLGRGQFGEVHQAIVRKTDEPEMLCAAKMARASNHTSAKVLLSDMQDELEIHLKLEQKHENVVNLVGVCSDGKGPFYILLEYCGNGSLISYLRKHEYIPDYVNTACRQTLSLEWKLNCALEISNGMKFLASHKIIHRDLAARNVLLDSNTVAKISDFGMAKDVYLKSYYKQRHEGTFPLRWMAIESIHSLDFTEKSDVWSFGVLCWEIFTDGKHPYYDIIDDQNVAAYILGGKKLKRPEHCPKFLYNIMLKCWSNKSFNRPMFRELYENLSEQIDSNQRGRKSLKRRVSESMMNTFSEKKRSLKRKLSRKGSRKSSTSSGEMSISSRKPSHCSNRILDDHEMKRLTAIVNSGADEEEDEEADLMREDENMNTMDFDAQEQKYNNKKDKIKLQDSTSDKRPAHLSLKTENTVEKHNSSSEGQHEHGVDSLPKAKAKSIGPNADFDDLNNKLSECTGIESPNTKNNNLFGALSVNKNVSMDGSVQNIAEDNTQRTDSRDEMTTDLDKLSNLSDYLLLKVTLPGEEFPLEANNDTLPENNVNRNRDTEKFSFENEEQNADNVSNNAEAGNKSESDDGNMIENESNFRGDDLNEINAFRNKEDRKNSSSC